MGNVQLHHAMAVADSAERPTVEQVGFAVKVIGYVHAVTSTGM